MIAKVEAFTIEIPFSTSPTIPSRYNFILSGCIIARNSTSLIANQKINNGGGLYCKGTVQMTETAVLNNSSVWGGGIYNAGPGLNIEQMQNKRQLHTILWGSHIQQHRRNCFRELCRNG